MSGTEHMLILAAARSKRVKLALQRWALRYVARLIAKLGPEHQASARLCAMLGSATSDGNTLAGRPVPRKPAPVIAMPRLYTRIVERHDD